MKNLLVTPALSTTCALLTTKVFPRYESRNAEPECFRATPCASSASGTLMRDVGESVEAARANVSLIALAGNMYTKARMRILVFADRRNIFLPFTKGQFSFPHPIVEQVVVNEGKFPL